MRLLVRVLAGVWVVGALSWMGLALLSGMMGPAGHALGSACVGAWLWWKAGQVDVTE